MAEQTIPEKAFKFTGTIQDLDSPVIQLDQVIGGYLPHRRILILETKRGIIIIHDCQIDLDLTNFQHVRVSDGISFDLSIKTDTVKQCSKLQIFDSLVRIYNGR